MIFFLFVNRWYNQMSLTGFSFIENIYIMLIDSLFFYKLVRFFFQHAQNTLGNADFA